MSVAEKWLGLRNTNTIHGLPETLRPHQEDTMGFLLSGKSVILSVPTGGGKTLPQLATSLLFEGVIVDSPPNLRHYISIYILDNGVGLVIPPLVAIELQV